MGINILFVRIGWDLLVVLEIEIFFIFISLYFEVVIYYKNVLKR